jgi:hypothetical protein
VPKVAEVLDVGGTVAPFWTTVRDDPVAVATALAFVVLGR